MRRWLGSRRSSRPLSTKDLDKPTCDTEEMIFIQTAQSWCVCVGFSTLRLLRLSLIRIQSFKPSTVPCSFSFETYGIAALLHSCLPK
jgi:hypothetical protein